MAPKFELRQEQTYSLMLTPTIQQALAILQLPRVELKELIRQEMSNNPLLEEEIAEVSVSEEKGEGGKVEASRELTLDWEEYLRNSEYWEYRTEGRPGSEAEKKRRFQESLIVKKPTLTDHLLRQLRLSAPSKLTYRIGELIIGNLDDNGYLRSEITEIASNLKVEKKEVEQVLNLVQTFDPPGVGARDLRECLLLQIKRRGLKRKSPTYRVVKDHLENLGKKRYHCIAKLLGVSVTEIQRVADFITTLEPKPGRQFSPEEAQYIIPDITVKKIGGRYLAFINAGGLPRLMISPFYRKMLKQGSNVSDSDRQYIKDKLSSALGLIRNIERRHQTVVKIAESIIEWQRKFLDEGIDYLKPLTMKELARRIGMHESTVSRAMANKYIQTPQGTFQLKYFVSGGFDAGKKTISLESIKEKIKDLVHSEDPHKPLSDQAIANIFIKQGIHIARRTVTKYRKELKILAGRERRRYL